MNKLLYDMEYYTTYIEICKTVIILTEKKKLCAKNTKYFQNWKHLDVDWTSNLWKITAKIMCIGLFPLPLVLIIICVNFRFLPDIILYYISLISRSISLFFGQIIFKYSHFDILAVKRCSGSTYLWLKKFFGSFLGYEDLR